MSENSALRRYLAEFVIIFVGVALAFAVENYREELNDGAIGEEYLQGFQRDLHADLEMLREMLETRHEQLANAKVILEFFDGRDIDPQVFFEAYNNTMLSWVTRPNRSTMDEVLNSGSLRLIRDGEMGAG